MAVKAKYIKDLPLKENLEGTDSLILQDDEGTKRSTLEVIGDKIAEEANKRVDELEKELVQTNTQLSDIKINKMDKGGEIVVSQINKNKGKFDQTYMTDEFLQQIVGNAPVHSVPADKSITPDKTTFINTGINLYNPKVVSRGVFISGTGGEQSNEVYVATDFIRVTEGLPYRYNGNENICRRDLCGFYDSNKNFLGRPEELGVTEHNPFTIPQGRGICYIRLSLHNTAYAINNFYFYQGTEWLDHEQNPYGEYLDLDYVPKLTPDKIPTVTSDMIGYKAIEPSNTNFFQRQGNLIKHDDLVFGSYVVRTNGNLAKNETYCCTDFIRLEQGKYYKRRGVVGNHYAYYDENKKFVDMGGQDLPDGQFTPPQGVVYIRGSIPYGGNMESALSASIVESTYDLSEPGVDKIPYSYLKTVNEIKSEDIRQEQIKLEHLGYLEKDDTNMLNMMTRVEGYYVDSDAGILRENEKYDVSQYIAVEPNAPYITNFCRTLAFYTEDYKYISGISQNPGEVVTRFTTPSNARFLRITTSKGMLYSHMLCRGTELPKEYVPYKLVMPSVIGLADEVVSPNNTTFFYRTGNLIKRDEIILNHYANHSTGTPSSNTAYCCTQIIKVIPRKFYSHKGIHDIHYAMFDANKVVVKHSNQALGNPFQVPENVHYMRFSISWSGDESKLDNVGLSLGAVYEDNKGYMLNPDYLVLTEKVESKDIKRNQIQLEHLGFLSTTENLLNLDTRTENHYVSWDTGNLGYNESYDVSDYLEVEPNTEYVTSHNRMMAFYDENKKYISGIENGTLPLVFTTPENAKYLRITIYKNTINSQMLKKGNILGDYVPFGYYLPDNLIAKKVDSNNDESTTLAINLPDEIHVANNTTLEIYNRYLLNTGNPDNYFFEYSCSVGQNMKRGLVIPKGTATGRYKLTVTVYNDSLDVVCSKQVYLNVHGKGEPLSSPVKLLCIGDSITNDKPWLRELDTLSKNLYGGKAIEFVGTRGGTYKHEGRSGYSSGGYVSDSSYGWQGNVKVKCPNLVVEPITKKQYNLPIGNGGTGKFEVEEVRVEEGVKWVYFNRLTGGGDVPKTGTATAIETSTQGDSVIEFTDVYVTSRNPFWNSTTKQVDFIHYEQNLLGTKPDVVQIYLGTNDYSSSSYIGNMKHLIDCLNRDWNVPIMIVLAPYRGNQDGMGKQSGTSMLNRKAHDVMWKQHRNILKELQGLDNVHIVPVAPCHDSEHNYGMVEGQVNSRNTSTTWYPTESVHPQECGYLQMADAMWGTLLSIILGTIG